MKPDWKDAPKWAKYIAMDSDGWWTWFSVLPVWDGEEWVLPAFGPGDYEIASDTPDCSGIDWDNAEFTIERRPK